MLSYERLDKASVRRILRENKIYGWRFSRGKIDKIYKTYRFKSFVEAVEFLNRVKDVAEEMEHHPDICIFNYNLVRVTLVTHDIGGLSRFDAELAARIEEIYRSLKSTSRES